ncbi:MAG: Uma2 family endonuclease [bacterium]
MGEAPDLTVEVVSPNDEVEAFEQKLDDYRQAGIPVIWVTLPGTQRAQVLTPDRRTDVPANGVLDGGDVLPGFPLSLSELFAGLEG